MNKRQEAQVRRALKAGGWKSVLPADLCIDILVAQGYTMRAAQRELSKGRSIDSS